MQVFFQKVVLAAQLLGYHIHIMQLGLQVIDNIRNIQVCHRKVVRLYDLYGGWHVVKTEPDKIGDALNYHLQLHEYAVKAFLLRSIRKILCKHYKILVVLYFLDIFMQRLFYMLLWLSENLNNNAAADMPCIRFFQLTHRACESLC